MSEQGRCRTCKWWNAAGPFERGESLGVCTGPKVYPREYDPAFGFNTSPRDGVVGVTLGIGLAVLPTAIDFGCIHHEEKESPNA